MKRFRSFIFFTPIVLNVLFVMTVPLWVDVGSLLYYLITGIGIVILSVQLWALSRLVKRHRLIQQLKCPSCEYDLRGTIPAGKGSS